MKKFDEFINEDKPAAGPIYHKFQAMVEDMDGDFETIMDMLPNLEMSGKIDRAKAAKINADIEKIQKEFKEAVKI